MQELSICLYNKVMQLVLRCHRRQMKKIVRRGLLPLFFHLSDQTQSVAKVRTSDLTRGTSTLPPQGLPCGEARLAARSPSLGCGAIPQLLLLCRPPWKPLSPLQTS